MTSDVYNNLPFNYMRRSKYPFHDPFKKTILRGYKAKPMLTGNPVKKIQQLNDNSREDENRPHRIGVRTTDLGFYKPPPEMGYHKNDKKSKRIGLSNRFNPTHSIENIFYDLFRLSR